MSRIIGDEPCPKCREKGRDRTGNHLMIFEDGGKYCNRCDYTVPSEEEEDIELDWTQYTVKDVLQLPIGFISERKLSQETADYLHTRVEYDKSTGEVDKVFYPYVKDRKAIGYKVRIKDDKGFKTFKRIGDAGTELYNQYNVPANGKQLLIVEGEEDVGAAYEMLGKWNPSIVSLVNGASVKKNGCGVVPKEIEENLNYIKSFEKVILCLDNDKVGNAVTTAIAELLGDDVYTLRTTQKDASDCLTKGYEKEFISSYFKPKPYAPEGFITVDDVWEEATAMPEWGKSWPWPTMTNLTYGRRLGEGIYFGAGVKIGKSEAVNQITHHITQVEGGKVALFKLEEKPAMTVRKIAGKIMHKQFHIPDGDFTQEELKEGVDKVRDGVILYDSYGSTGWDKLKAAIRHAVVVEGCEDIIIDPLTRLTVGMDSGSANTELERISDEISKMAKDLGFFYMIFAHLKAPLSGPPHEEGGKVHSNQFTGSRAMMRACYYMVGIERNKRAEDEVERNTSTFVLLEDRSFGRSGEFPVYYNPDTGDYLEPNDSFTGGL